MPEKMNIFEDLIEELKEENLLEETVIEVQKKKDENSTDGLTANNSQISFNENSQFPVAPSILTETSPVRENSFVIEKSENLNEKSLNKLPANEFLRVNSFELPLPPTDFSNEMKMPETESAKPADEIPVSFSDSDGFNADDSFDTDSPSNQAEFYKKRATDEVTSLQMVEHVLSGIERDFLNVQPALYDDLEVKKSLHNFLQFAQNTNSPEQAQAEFLLMQETESWYSALSQKDKNITVYNLRRYCETTRPALSSQALAALSRFYRNAPFSESIRSKFDLVITRYFAREAGGDIRKLIFSRDEIVEKLNEFYAEWSSIPLYATDDDESNILLAAIKFEEFMTEAEEAQSFEELLKTEFFQRLKAFKESTHENFFAPMVTASSIESNVRIGNRYLELLLKAKENHPVESLEEKYGILHNQLISEVICKTLQITNVFEGKFADADIVREVPVEAQVTGNQLEFEKQDLKKSSYKTPKTTVKTESGTKFKVNKWLLAATIFVVLCSVGLYAYVEFFNPPPKLSENVKTVNLDNSSLKEYFQAARLNGDMFYGIVNPSWEGLSKEKQEELLRKILLIGSEKGFKTVTLMNREGRNVGFASSEKVETYMP